MFPPPASKKPAPFSRGRRFPGTVWGCRYLLRCSTLMLARRQIVSRLTQTDGFVTMPNAVFGPHFDFAVSWQTRNITIAPVQTIFAQHARRPVPTVVNAQAMRWQSFASVDPGCGFWSFDRVRFCHRLWFYNRISLCIRIANRFTNNNQSCGAEQKLGKVVVACPCRRGGGQRKASDSNGGDQNRFDKCA